MKYFNVLEDTDALQTMLKHSDGARRVPVIVDQDTVTIGFNGRA